MIKKVCVPKCYGQFQCIAADCTDSCCAGWQVDVDSASWEYYKTVEGEFGDYIRSVMVEGGDCGEEKGQFRLRENGRCPFLMDDNLCDLYAHLGEDKLCKTCTNFPRFMEDYGELREVGIAFSCPEASRLMLSTEEPMEFVVEDAVKEPIADMAKDVMWRTKGMGCETLEETIEDGYIIGTEVFDQDYFNVLYECRKIAFSIVQNRNLTIQARVLLYLDFAVNLQDILDHEAYIPTQEKTEIADDLADISDYTHLQDAITEICYQYADEQWLKKRYDFLVREEATKESDAEGYDLYGEPQKKGTLKYAYLPEYAAVLYQELKHCKPQWGPMLEEAEQLLHKDMDVDSYNQCYKEFQQYYRANEYEYEHLLSYFVFKYFLKAYFDDDVYGKAQLACMGYLIVRELAVCQWVKQNRRFTKQDQIELFHLYSREMEHSEENYDMFLDSLKMESICNYEHLRALLVEEIFYGCGF